MSEDTNAEPLGPGGPRGGRRDETAHWSSFAERWANLTSPGRPHQEDVRRYETCVADHGGDSLSALLLGVTPEIVTMRWPLGSAFVAVDRSREVIQTIWPRARTGAPANAVAGWWQHLPLLDGSVDLAIGDGCLSALGTLAAQNEVSRELVRVLRPGGRFIMRLFVAPEVRESTQSVFDDLLAGRIGAFDTFKWRLLMAAPADADHAVRLGDAFELWADARIDRSRLAEAMSWPRARIDTIDYYRNDDARLSFPPLEEALAQLTPFFHIRGQFTQHYELAERCPIVVMTRRDVVLAA